MKIGTFISATFAVCIVGMAQSTSVRAEGSMLQKCRPGSSKAVLEKCCTNWVREHGKPYWMQEAGLSCATAISCSGGSSGGGLAGRLAVSLLRCSLQPPRPGNGNIPTLRRSCPPTVAC
jgi:hypothetical protein